MESTPKRWLLIVKLKNVLIVVSMKVSCMEQGKDSVVVRNRKMDKVRGGFQGSRYGW